MSLERRNAQWDALNHGVFDVAIIGGGINGACLYHHLCHRGYRVLLVEKGDFASGTSQASAMMIWGGLLYLCNWDLATVWRLCSSRDRMIREMGKWVRACNFRYIPIADGSRSRGFAHLALYFYWFLGGCRRLRPRRERDFPERGFLKEERLQGSLLYQEACLEPSDARFVLWWILPHQTTEQVALNYCLLHGGGFDHATRQWCLELTDTLLGRPAVARAKWVINAAGVWTDSVNQCFGRDSPYTHVFSKGVFLGFPRDPRHQVPLIFDTRTGGDVMSFIPWGPVSLWGPSETTVRDLEEGFSIEPHDVSLLLDEVNRHLVHPVTPSDVVSLRCGVRALVVPKSAIPKRPSLDLSRRERIHCDKDLPWISVYGGKLTSCVSLAMSVTSLLGCSLAPAGSPSTTAVACDTAIPELVAFPSLAEKVPSARWCAANEMCWNLEDYLRRRTNIAQWVPRGGLGFTGENIWYLMDLAKVFARNNEAEAKGAVAAYQRKIERECDKILAEC